MRYFHAPYRFDLAASGLLFAAALAVRLPNLMLIPTFIDESVDVLMGLDIAQGHHWVLTFRYIGPLFLYLTAALFRVFGVNLELTRLTVAVLGAALPVVVYWLGRRMAGRMAGLVAALITLVSPVLVIESSHYAWSNSLTPLFVALTLLALYEGVTTARPVWLALAGLLAALALQTHPLSAVALVGMGLYGIRRLPLSKWYGAAALFLLVDAPVIVGNLREWQRFSSWVDKAQYAFAPTVSPAEYLSRLMATLKTAGHIVLAGYGPLTIEASIMILVVTGLILVGLWGASRRADHVLLYTLLSSLVLYPLLVKVTYQRYLAFIVPLAALAIGIGVSELLRLARRGEARPPGAGRWRPRGWAVAILILPVLLAAYAALNVNGYYREMTARGVTNAEHFRLRDMVRENNACGPSLVIAGIQPDFNDPVVSRTWFGLLAMDYVLTMEGCGHTVAEPDKLGQRLAEARPTAWLLTSDTALVPPPGYQQADLIGTFELGVIDGRANPLALYRLG